MKLNIQKATTSKLIEVFISDSSSTTGGGLTGLVFNTTSLTAYYMRNGAASATAITLATMTVGTWVSSGFVEIDATNLPGWYQIGLPDAVLATGVDSVGIHLKGATSMAPLPLEIQLVSYDPNDAVRMGLNALPNAAADAAGGLSISDAGGLDLDAKLASTNEITVARMATLTDWGNGGRLDLILDIIAADVVNIDGAAMRGTDSAALASAWTAVRAGYLDNINGHTAQTGDNFAIVNGTAGLVAIDTVVNAIKLITDALPDAGALTTIGADTARLTAIRAQVLTDWIDGARLDLLLDAIPTTPMRGTDNAALASIATEVRLAELDAANIPSDLSDIQGATFNGTTDSLESIRNRGDSAWVTGGGGSNPVLLQSTTIATLASQTSFTLTAGSSDNSAYNDAVIVITDSTSSEQKAFGVVSNFIGATKTITLPSDPGIFTMAVGDTVDIVAIAKIIPTVTVNTDMRGTDGANTTTPPTVTAIRQEMDSNSVDLDAILTYVDELETRLTAVRAVYLDNLNSHTPQSGDTFAQLPANFSDLSIVVTTGLVNITQTAADKVWGTTTRTLTSFGTLVSDIWSNSTRTITDKVGFALSATGLDTITSTATGMVEIAKAVWDRLLTGATHNVTNSAGKIVRQLKDVNIIHSGTAQAGSSTTITLAAGADSNDDFYAHTWVVITGNTGAGQVRSIHTYNGTTKVGTLSTGDTWTITPDNTSEYEIVRGAFTHVGDMSTAVLNAINVEVDNALNTAIPGSPTADSINERVVAIDALTQVAGNGDLAAMKAIIDLLPNSGALNDLATLITRLTAVRAGYLDSLNGHTAQSGDTYAQIPTNFSSLSISAGGLVDILQSAADKVWSTTTRTLTAFSTSFALTIWDVLESAITTVNSIGLKVKTNLDNTVSSRSSHSASDVTTDIDTNSTNLNQIITDIAAVKVDTAAILIDTNELQGDWTNGGRLDTILDAILLDTGTDGVVLSSIERLAIADAILDRDMSIGTDSGTTTTRTIRQALRSGRNKITIAGGVMTVYKEDDTTASWTATITTTAGNPISQIDPAG